MLARAFARNVGWAPSVSVSYSRPDGGAVVDRLEYVPIDTTIGQIVAACGARRVRSEANVALYVRVAGTSSADESAFEDRIAADVAAGRAVAGLVIPSGIVAIVLSGIATQLAASNARFAGAEVGVTAALAGVFIANGLRVLATLWTDAPDVRVAWRCARVAIGALAIVLVIRPEGLFPASKR